MSTFLWNCGKNDKMYLFRVRKKFIDNKRIMYNSATYLHTGICRRVLPNVVILLLLASADPRGLLLWQCRNDFHRCLVLCLVGHMFKYCTLS